MAFRPESLRIQRILAGLLASLVLLAFSYAVAHNGKWGQNTI
ncbi:hypothetical protein C943_00475 [Mariniradius saccharolyticus AK6]|uniref:Uncharacterized protein n=1 Tax=Mariniradius saccharolyticus AK6 TaxID=1239962 RepID=M7XF70_9BACT|nr:hypothetical protein C943_00475 [Mariniradius saccharolyticus AK6]